MAKTESGVTEQIASSYAKSGSMRAAALEVGVHRRTVERHLRKAGLLKKPLAGGKQRAQAGKTALPKSGKVKRFILTAAQNNTYVHKAFWENLLAMAKH